MAASSRPRWPFMQAQRKYSIELINIVIGFLFFFCEWKVLIGCDGVNSVAAKWLGFKKPAFAGRSAIRGFSDFKCSHGLEPIFLEFLGDGVKSGFLPCDDQTVYWFFSWRPSSQGNDPFLKTCWLHHIFFRKQNYIYRWYKWIIAVDQMLTSDT